MNVQYKTALPDALADASDEPEKPARNIARSIFRGIAGKCPSCGQGSMFDGFLSVRPACQTCGEELHHQRADDAPPYFTITIVGHIIIPALLAVELLWRPALWIHMALWIPLTILLALVLMRPVKGALVALQWALYMHGFDPDAGEDLPEPDPAASIK